MMSILTLTCILVYLSLLGAVYYSQEEKRWYYPEYKFRAHNARNASRTGAVEQTLRAGAGVYKNKTRGEEKALSKTVFVSVVAYNEKSFYKLYFHNLLCFTQHHDIDIVVYLIHHNLAEPEREIQQLRDVGIKVLTYPDELFWTLLYSKSNDVKVGTGKGDYASKVPSFTSHGALVMLVPVLEALLHGYNVIFMDVDIALVVDPIPYLTRGHADFVSTVEMRSCPDHYTPTYFNVSEHMHGKRGHTLPKLSNSVDNMNWYTIEPNTGTMLVRSTEAAIGFYTRWLIDLIGVNEMNDQKALLRDHGNSIAVRDCVYGQPTVFDHTTHSAYQGHTNSGSGSGDSSGKHNKFRRSPHLGSHFDGRAAHVDGIMRTKWLSNYTTLVNDVVLGKYRRHAKFCFLSEILFQNGQTAIICGVKPSFKDSWILEMNKHGLQRIDANGEENNYPHDEHADAPRFPVTLHANYCDRKTHELTVRGLWLVRGESADYNFNSSTCRAFNPYETFYAKNNWTDDARLVNNKRKYMYDTFVVPGGLIQSTTGREVYMVDANRHKQLIPDGDTFIAKVGENKWGDIKLLPQPIMDLVPFGEPIPSVLHPPQPVAVSVTVAPAASPTASPTAAISAKPTTTTGTSASATGESASAFDKWFQSATRGYGQHTQAQKPTQRIEVPTPKPPDYTDTSVHRGNSGGYSTQPVTPGMLLRTVSSPTVYYIDKRGARRKVPNEAAFARLFPGRAKDVKTIPDKGLQMIPVGDPLL